MESQSADADRDDAERAKVVSELPYSDDSKSLVLTVTSMSEEVNNGESVTDEPCKSVNSKINFSSEFEEGINFIDDCENDDVNERRKSVDRQSECESEMSSVSTYTTVVSADEDFDDEMFEDGNAEKVGGKDVCNEELGVVQSGSMRDTPEGLVEAFNFHGIATGKQSKLELNYDRIEVLHEELQFLDVLNTTFSQRCTPEDSFTDTPLLEHDNINNVDSSDRNNNSSDNLNEDVKLEIGLDPSEMEPMTCAQFVMLVNKENPKQSPNGSEPDLSMINESGFSGFRRLDTITSIEGEDDELDKDFEKTSNSVAFLKASSNITDSVLPPSSECPADKNVERPNETPVRRKSTGIFIKRREKEGRSRSPSPIPRRYRKHSAPIQKHPLVLEYEDNTALTYTCSNSNPNINAECSKFFNESSLKVNMNKIETFQIMDHFSETQNIPKQKDEELKENAGSVDPFEPNKSSPIPGQITTKYIEERSISGVDIPSVHRSRPIQIDVGGKRYVYDLISYKGVVSPDAPNDDFGFDIKAKKELQNDKYSSNEDIFTNRAVLAAFAHKKLKALRNSFRRERKRTVSSGSESTSSETSRRRLESQSSLVLKLTERDYFNRDVIEGFIEPIKLPPKKQRTLSTGDENPVSVESKPKTARTQRSRSDGHLGQNVPVTIKIPTVLVEPWKGAWNNTVLRIVEPNDTLASVAAHFDITPSELAILNRLPSRTVFPGQVIRVPDKRRRDQDSEDKENKQDNPESDKGDDKEKGDDKSEVCDEEMDMLEKLRLTSPKPGHAERVRTPLSPAPDTSHQRFLKINVRHITDGQGVVSGVLLVTSNAVMFDPNVSDPLVIEHGPESYGVIAPMEYVVNVAIYHDIAHMRVGSHDQFRPDWPKPEVYHLKDPFPPVTDGEGSSGTLLTINQGDSLDSGDPHHSPSAREDSLLAKDETFPELRSSTEDEEEEDAGSLCSCSVPREGDAFPKAFDRDLVTPTNLTTTTDKQESEAEDPTPKNESVALIRSLEERRKSSLDHHWAVPSKVRSLEEQSASVSDTQVMDNNRRNSEGLLVKLSCHDSGIDIRDPPPVVPQVPRKSTYSDADVLLSDDFVPPVPIQPLRATGAAVSFSLDQSQERSVSESHDGINLRDKDDHEKETKKNKMLKRLSYPLSWMEGLSGDKEEKDSLPSSAESHPPSSHSASSSVFSKVFSSSPINMVTDFSSGLFTKTPSEEGGRFPFPPSTPEPPPTPASADPSKSQGLASFSPSNITSAITNVGRSSVGTFIRQQHQPHVKDKGPKLDYRSMVSVEDMPELFVSFDKLIPRPAQSCDDPPLYLRLRMGKPKDKKIPKSTPIMSYGKKKMRPEYWFSVPRERVDDLYRFLMVWVPQLYGDLDEVTVADRGYELVDSDTELWETEDHTARQDGRRGSEDDDLGDLTRESWEVLKAPYCKLYTILKTQAAMGSTETGDEVLSMSEELRRALYASSSLDLELCLPDLNGVTEILSEDHRKQLCRHLPARAEGYVWTLVFSTSQHGFSLNSMYRKMTRIESPILMVIQDTENNVFGALTSCALKMSDHFYGTGESLLFRFATDIQVYNWTGDNLYFIKGNNESLSIGAGDGKFGLWLDGDLYQGRTEPCNTYGNDPLTPSVDFVVKTLECWAFI